eukprot:c15255_g1_i1.p1 GENE.c15255_g1_i1~~c15255_g1_i1.p1  ORF type:complete len:425 (+),score=169.22 c15255_g1_i1:42-1316(+)
MLPSTESDRFEEKYSSPNQSQESKLALPELVKSPYRCVVTVSDPMKHGEGIKAYTRYKVTTQCNIPNFDPNSTVMRRYSEFDWLHSQLKQNCVGVILPPFPEKSARGKFEPEFVEARRKGLEEYIQGVVAHPLLCTSPDLKTFLQSPEEIDNSKQQSSASATTSEPALKSFFGKVKELQVSAQIGLTQSGWIKQDIPLPHDVQCAEMKAYLAALEAQLTAVQQISGKMTQQHRNVANAFTDFGNASTLLGNCETDTQFLSNGLGQLGTTSNRLSSTFHEQADGETEQFQNKISDHIKSVNSAKEAVKGREKMLQAYHAALTTLESKKSKLEKLKAQTPTNSQKIAEAEKELQDAELEVAKAREAHDSVSKITRQEMLRFQKEKVDDFKSMVVDYVKSQIEFSRKVQNTWEALIPEIDALAQEVP